MSRSLQADLRRLDQLAFRRRRHCGPLIEKFHRLESRISRSPDAALLWNIYDWLLIPLSLWPIDFEGLASHLIGLLESFSSSISGSASARSDPSHPSYRSDPSYPSDSSGSDSSLPIQIQNSKIENLDQLLKLIDPPPGRETQSVVAEFERFVESGRYEKMLKQAEKFDEQEKALLQNEQLASEWAELKRTFNLKDFQNARGVIRRRMSQERNFREGTWQFDWSDPRRRFHLFFDAFCYRWKLYGMEYDRPLLLKISVNPTPHGTMIVIPRHWSLDPRRDLDWSLINRLHRSRGAKKQGPKLSPARVEKLDEAKRIKQLWQTAKKRG